MAVKEKTQTTQKISNPTGPIKIDDKDLNTLKTLQQDTDKLIYNLGQIYVQKEKINQTEISLKKLIKNIEQREGDLGKELSSKYGVGSVDIAAGTFTPTS